MISPNPETTLSLHREEELKDNSGTEISSFMCSRQLLDGSLLVIFCIDFPHLYMKRKLKTIRKQLSTAGIVAGWYPSLNLLKMQKRISAALCLVLFFKLAVKT